MIRKFFRAIIIALFCFNACVTNVYAETKIREYYSIDLDTLNINVKQYLTSLSIDKSTKQVYMNNVYVGIQTNDTQTFTLSTTNYTINAKITLSSLSVEASVNVKTEKIYKSAFKFEIEDNTYYVCYFYPDYENSSTSQKIVAVRNGETYNFNTFSYTYGNEYKEFNVKLIQSSGDVYVNGNKIGTLSKSNLPIVFEYIGNNFPITSIDYMHGKLAQFNWDTASQAKYPFYNRETDFSNISIQQNYEYSNEYLSLPSVIKSNTPYVNEYKRVGGTSTTGTGVWQPTGNKIWVVCEYYENEECGTAIRKEFPRYWAVYASETESTYPVISKNQILEDYVTKYKNYYYPIENWTKSDFLFPNTTTESAVIQYKYRRAIWSDWTNWTSNTPSEFIKLSGIASDMYKYETSTMFKYRTWGYVDATGWSADTNYCDYMRDSTIKAVTDTRQDSLCGTQYKTCTVSTKVRCTKTREENYTCKVDSTCSRSYDCSYDESYDTTCPYTYSCNCYDYCPRTDSRGNCMVAKQRKCSTCTGSQRCTKTRHVSKTCWESYRCQVDGTCTRTVSYDDVCDSSSTGRYEVCGTENKTCTLTKCQSRVYHDWTDWTNEDMCRGAGTQCEKSSYSITGYRYRTKEWSEWSDWYVSNNHYNQSDDMQYQYRKNDGIYVWETTKGNSIKGSATIGWYSGEYNENEKEKINVDIAKASTNAKSYNNKSLYTQSDVLAFQNEYARDKSGSSYLETLRGTELERGTTTKFIKWSDFNYGITNYSGYTQALNTIKDSRIYSPYLYFYGWRFFTDNVDMPSGTAQKNVSAADFINYSSTGKLLENSEPMERDTKVIYFDYHDPLTNYDEYPENWQGYEELVRQIENSDLSNAKIKVKLSADDITKMKEYLENGGYDKVGDCSMIREFSYIFITTDTDLQNWLNSGSSCKIGD